MKKMQFNDGWIFYKQNSEDKKIVTLPHDAMLEETRSADCESGSAGAFFPGGIYVYEKTFSVPEDWKGKHTELVFEGVYQKAVVEVNGERAGSCEYGYSSFSVSLDGHLRYGEENEVRVTADNSQVPNSRWYSGAGIYRPVWICTGGRSYIEWKGLKIKTLSVDPAVIEVTTSQNGGATEIEITDQGRVLAQGKGNSLRLEIPDARLWSDENPYLYQCHARVRENEKVVDEAEETFGIRLLKWNETGFYVNGKETPLRGGCVHHDNGLLGAKSYGEAEWRRVRKLKEAGFNAIRSSHNPCSDEMANACDYYGVYLIDELWDMWFFHKNRYDYAAQFMENYQFDIEQMVEKDYNHPSVVMYSIGNEVSEPATDKGLELAQKMTETIHRLDETRPVTGGFNLMIISRAANGKGIYNEEGGRADSESKMPNSSLMFNMITSMVGTGMNKGANSAKADAIVSPVLDTVDIAGYNYASGRYPLERKQHPKRVIFGSETFPQDIVKNWEMVEKYPYLIGDFMWSAWDYMGEAGSGAWTYEKGELGFEKPYPWLLAEMGVIDILGNPNGELYLAQTVWQTRHTPAIAVRPVNRPGTRPAKSTWRGTNAIPSWSWRDCDGNKAVVEVYAEGASAQLLLNGRKVGKKKIKNYQAKFTLKYVPGELEAIIYDNNGNETGRSSLTSAGQNVSIQIRQEEKTRKDDEWCYLDISIADAEGNVESNFDRNLKITVENGELAAFGSAAPRIDKSYLTGDFPTYYGRAQAIVRSDTDKAAIVRVNGEGLEEQTLILKKERADG